MHTDSKARRLSTTPMTPAPAPHIRRLPYPARPKTAYPAANPSSNFVIAHVERATLSAFSRRLPVEPPSQALPASTSLSQPRAVHTISSAKSKRARKKHGRQRQSIVSQRLPAFPDGVMDHGTNHQVHYCFSSSQRFPSCKTAISGELHTLAAQPKFPDGNTFAPNGPVLPDCPFWPLCITVHSTNVEPPPTRRVLQKAPPTLGGPPSHGQHREVKLTTGGRTKRPSASTLRYYTESMMGTSGLLPIGSGISGMAMASHGMAAHPPKERGRARDGSIVGGATPKAATS
ncbi:hypothetical protein CPLU01_09613 [Colletotrichum plurivorum]|uniref:Uncharacterized protein n=1 Tax=Colletotrichum plurivorum TaxID=2175906 RepID=A0A8H6K983_9PEZI|nr:hypothetical protein CPLU01_09613 [Colletotrichum plurivorum]